MTTQAILKGTRFRVNRSTNNPPASPAVYNYLCSAVTISFSKKKVLEDATVANCDNPNATPDREAVSKENQWDLTFSGKVDPLGFNLLEADQAADAAYPYQLIRDLAGAQGGKTWTGNAWITDLTQTKTDNGIVSFTVTLQGDGPLTETALA